MANGLDAKANGKGTSHSPAAPVLESPEMGHEPADFSGLAVSNFAFAEELYYQYLRDPGSVDAGWRRYFDTLSRGNGAGAARVRAAGRVQAQHLRGQRRRGVRGGRDRQPHVGAPAVRARAAAGRGVSRDGTPVRRSSIRSGSCSAGIRRSRSRTSRSKKRTWTWCSAAKTSRVRTARRCAIWPACCARPTAAPSASSWPTCTTSSCVRGCRTAWRARATGWR